MFGIGAVGAALNIGAVRRRFSGEASIRLAALLMGLAICVVAISHWAILTGAALLLAGAAWMISLTLFNIGIQLTIPRWVAGRALAGFQAAIAGGIALGSWIWGHIASGMSVDTALLMSGVTMASLPLLGLWLRMPEAETPADEALEARAEPEVNLNISGRSGPIVIEIEYCIEPSDARCFYGVMQRVQLIRQRNGAYNWSLARDIAAPAMWMERFHCPTWLDYLRQRSRSTEAERMIEREAMAFHGGGAVRVRRMLERPLGSVRWKDETPDRKDASKLSPPTGI